MSANATEIESTTAIGIESPKTMFPTRAAAYAAARSHRIVVVRLVLRSGMVGSPSLDASAGWHETGNADGLAAIPMLGGRVNKPRRDVGARDPLRDAAGRAVGQNDRSNGRTVGQRAWVHDGPVKVAVSD